MTCNCIILQENARRALGAQHGHGYSEISPIVFSGTYSQPSASKCAEAGGRGSFKTWIPWFAKITRKWVLEQITSELSLKERRTKLRLPLFGRIMRRLGSQDTTIKLGNSEGSKKGGSPHTRWVDSMKEAGALGWRELSRAVKERNLSEVIHSFLGSLQGRINLTVCTT